MQFMTSVTDNKPSNPRKLCKPSDQHIALQLRYGKIGIPAVAAAARYQSGAKSSGLPPVVVELHRRGATTG